ncbi:MAG: shikimate kinase [Acidobacteria bacterium]|nr:shikimate kinase [Acidobacteriota bacterium]
MTDACAPGPLAANVYLIGFTGAGKTTVGEALARDLGVPFADLDAAVETRAGLSVVEIFRRHGELFFRAAEAEAFKALAERKGWVVALGSGTYAIPGAKALADSTGLSVWLECPFEELLLRCSRAHAPRHPALDENSLRGLYLQRLPAYESAALRISTGGVPVRAVVEDLVRTLRWRGMVGGGRL